jgi:hypothetical protein
MTPRRPTATIKASLVTVLAKPKSIIERGNVIRVQAFINNRDSYAVEGTYINGCTRPENLEAGVYALRYRDNNRCQYHFFLVNDSAEIEQLSSVQTTGITDGRIPSPLFDAKLLSTFQMSKTRNHIQIINSAEL